MSLPQLNDLIADLQLAKEIAIQNGNANSLVSATLAQAKLLGLDKPQANDEASLKPRIIELVPALTPEIARAINRELESEY